MRSFLKISVRIHLESKDVGVAIDVMHVPIATPRMRIAHAYARTHVHVHPVQSDSRLHMHRARDLLSLRAKRDTLRRNNLLPFSRNTCTTPVLICAVDSPTMMLLLTYGVVPSTSVSKTQNLRCTFPPFLFIFLASERQANVTSPFAYTVT